MTMQVTIGLNAETLSAISDLAAAIRSISGVASTAPATSTKTAAAANAKAGAGDKVVEKETDGGAEVVTIYWGNHTAKTYGIVDSEDAYKALKKKDAKIVKLTQAQYDKKQAEIAEAAKAAGGDDDEDAPSLQDVIDAFSKYLPADLDEELKVERRTFVKALAGRFDVKKASDIPEEHRKLAINLVLRKLAGQDIDPEVDEFDEEFDADEDSLV
ncbi:hypothetical protein GOD54_23410 [Sinorhizobium medicae]|nr:hypothetical protein [Sinorhizobium medicae]